MDEGAAATTLVTKSSNMEVEEVQRTWQIQLFNLLTFVFLVYLR